MKRFLILAYVFAGLLLGVSGCDNSEKQSKPDTVSGLECEPLPGQLGSLHFCKLEHDWGTIPHGDSVFAFYTFKNVSKKPQRITNVITSCECTVGEFSRDPIPPGAYGQIIGKFFSETQQIARFEKILAVEVEGENFPFTLMLKGNVVPAQ